MVEIGAGAGEVEASRVPWDTRCWTGGEALLAGLHVDLAFVQVRGEGRIGWWLMVVGWKHVCVVGRHLQRETAVQVSRRGDGFGGGGRGMIGVVVVVVVFARPAVLTEGG